MILGIHLFIIDALNLHDSLYSASEPGIGIYDKVLVLAGLNVLDEEGLYGVGCSIGIQSRHTEKR